MKNKMKKIVCLLCAGVMVMSLFVGCGNSGESGKTTDDTKQEDVKDDAQEQDAETTDGEEEETGAGTIEALLESVADEDAYMVLSGVADGWAPTVMVLLNDGTFYCLVDYAGQATVNFCTGEYVVNDDQSITATGALYTDGSELVYEIAQADGNYTVSVAIPDTDAVGELTGTLAE